MKLLDLFCGAGGAATGYYQAGFDTIVGVDNKPQKHYPFEFIQADVFDFMKKSNIDFDVIHASPPCQAYSISKNTGCHKNAPHLISKTRRALKRTGAVYVIENVRGAPLLQPFMLCGASFKLGVCGFDLARHRYFESNMLILAPPCQHKRGKTIGVYGHGTNSWHREKFGRCVRTDELREAMGIDWMTRAELSQAIPPAYTKYIGEQIINQLHGPGFKRMEFER